MAYILRRTDGRTVATILDGGFNGDTDSTVGSTSLTFPGKNYGPYAEIIAANFMKLLENFSHTTAPNHPLSGQVWYDKNANTLKVFSPYGMGNVWRSISPTISSSTPTGLYPGDSWFNTITEQLFVRREDGSDTLIGPLAETGFGGNTEIRAETIVDVGSVERKVLGFYVDGILVMMLTAGGAFASSVPGFAQVNNGFTANTFVTDNLFTGTATNSLLFDSRPTTDFFIRNVDQDTTGNIQIKSDNTFRSLILGDTSQVLFRRNGIDGVLENKITSGGWILKGSAGNLIVAKTSQVGVLTDSPVTTLDVAGSFKTKFTYNGTASPAATVDALLAGSYELVLSAPTTITITNLNTAGQTLRLVLVNTTHAVSWAGPSIIWPNNVVTPNFAAGPSKIVAINLLRTSGGVIATYVTY